MGAKCNQPQRGCRKIKRDDSVATPLGLFALAGSTQGSRFAPTLGWRPQSLWDWPTARTEFYGAVLHLYSGAFKALTRSRFFKVRSTTSAESVEAVATTDTAKA